MEKIQLQPLFFLQRKLDKKIMRNSKEPKERILLKKALALKVEIGELMNETRIFKYWSKKGPSERETILEEYVDGLHFIISLAIDKGYENYTYQGIYQELPNTKDDLLLRMFDELLKFDWFVMNNEHFEEGIEMYIHLGYALGFKWVDIQHAYIQKNIVNHERQEHNY